MRCRRGVVLAAGLRVRERSKLRVAAILVLQRRQRGMARCGRIMLRMSRRGTRQAAKGAQARLLGGMLGLLLLGLLRLVRRAWRGLLRGRLLLLARLRLELLSV